LTHIVEGNLPSTMQVNHFRPNLDSFFRVDFVQIILYVNMPYMVSKMQGLGEKLRLWLWGGWY